MGVFEYLGVLISVIMGLGVTHLATGASKLIHNRDSVKFYLPHALWTVNVLIFILLIRRMPTCGRFRRSTFCSSGSST
ncbi:MAG: hypothetical protein QNI98_00930 [Woeseiaceae bacterium]|nr:hypothetical protein [Woeseiaceae bacterium]